MARQARQVAMRLRPAATAYALGLLSSTSPRVLRVLFLLFRSKLGPRAAWLQLCGILRQAFAIHRFSTFCGVLVGGSTLLQAPVRALILLFLRHVSPTDLGHGPVQRLARFLAALISASCSFNLLNRQPRSTVSSTSRITPQPSSHLDVCEPGPFDQPPETPSLEVDDSTLKAKSLSKTDLAGRTMDLTLFAAIRALDIVLSRAWQSLATSTQSPIFSRVSQGIPPALFCFSAATIMHSWFYSPSRLPQAYNRWISAAAELDHRLLLALRHARYGTWIYGKDTGMAPLLGSMCHDYGLPEALGDPAQTCPVPCELVHMGCGKSCERHALIRFGRGWAFAAKMYAPLQLLVLIKNMRALHGSKARSKSASVLALRAIIDTARSSAFLGAFIAFFYYGVCLSRTRLGPRLFSSKTVTPQMWDSGLCVLGGCLLCGTSILVEQQKKRMEILLFVLPRAAATWFPRRYLPEHRWIEHVAFTLSTAIVLTTAQEAPKRVRGVLGVLLHRLLKPT